MLAFIIATFFALTLVGALLVISYMFFEYQDKVKAVFLAELSENNAAMKKPEVRVTHNLYQHPATKTRQFNSGRLVRPARKLRAAA